MARKAWGAGQVERVEVPKLSEWAEDHPLKTGDEFQVIKVSKSDKWKSYTFECLGQDESRFRVNVYERSPVYELFSQNFKEWREKSYGIFIVITDDDWQRWELNTDDDVDCKWVNVGGSFNCSKIEAR